MHMGMAKSAGPEADSRICDRFMAAVAQEGGRTWSGQMHARVQNLPVPQAWYCAWRPIV